MAKAMMGFSHLNLTLGVGVMPGRGQTQMF